MSKVISIASGKGGVGKTMTAVQIALSSCRQGFRTLVIDGDLGMANVDVVLGLRPLYNISDVLSGTVQLSDIILHGPMGMHIVPSGSGLSEVANLSLSRRVCLLDQLSEVSDGYDVVIIDSGSGISDTVVHLNLVSDDVLVVTTPEPHALTDAYALIKVLIEKDNDISINLMVNQVVTKDQGLKIADRVADVVSRFLRKKIAIIGAVPFNDLVPRAVMSQAVGSDLIMQTSSGQAWNEVAHKILRNDISNSDLNWERFIFPSATA